MSWTTEAITRAFEAWTAGITHWFTHIDLFALLFGALATCALVGAAKLTGLHPAFRRASDRLWDRFLCERAPAAEALCDDEACAATRTSMALAGFTQEAIARRIQVIHRELAVATES